MWEQCLRCQWNSYILRIKIYQTLLQRITMWDLNPASDHTAGASDFNYSVMVTLKDIMQHSPCHRKHFSINFLVSVESHSWCQNSTGGLKQITMWDSNPGTDCTAAFKHQPR